MHGQQLSNFLIGFVTFENHDNIINQPSKSTLLNFQKSYIAESKELLSNANKIGEINSKKVIFENSDNFEQIALENINMGEGIVYLDVKPKPDLFYKVLSMQCGQEIKNDFQSDVSFS